MDVNPPAPLQHTTKRASTVVGNLPELCRMILLGVPDDNDWEMDSSKNLASCSTVCKMWHAQAEPILYRSVYLDRDHIRIQKLCDSIAAQPQRALFAQKLFVARLPIGEVHRESWLRFLKILPTLLNLQHLILQVERVLEDLTDLPFRLLSFTMQSVPTRQDALRRFFLSQPSIERLDMWFPLCTPADGSWCGILPRLRSAFLVCDNSFSGMEATLLALPSHLTDLTLVGPTQRTVATALHTFGPHLRSLRVRRPRWTDPEYPIPFWPTSLLEFGDAPQLRRLEVDDVRPRTAPMQDREALEDAPMSFPGMDRAAGQIRTVVWRPEHTHDESIEWLVRFLTMPAASGSIPAQEYSAVLLATFPTLQRVILPRAVRGRGRVEYLTYTRNGQLEGPMELQDPTEY